MTDTTVFILASGPEPQWTDMTPRQLMLVENERLIDRTIRLVQEAGENPIVVCDKPNIQSALSNYFKPAFTRWIYDTILSTQSLWHGKLVFLAADFIFYPELIRKILNTEVSCPWVGIFGVMGLVITEEFWKSGEFSKLLQVARAKANQLGHDELQIVMSMLPCWRVDYRSDAFDFDFVQEYKDYQTRLKEVHDGPTLVLLMAGSAKRMQGTINYPKGLIDFEGSCLAELYLDEAARQGFSDVVIVVGYEAEKVKDWLGNRRNFRSIHYVVNPEWETTGAGYSLKLAQDFWLGRSCLVMESDFLFHYKLCTKLFGMPEDCMLVDTSRKVAEGDVLVIGERGKVDRLIWPAKGDRANLLAGLRKLILPEPGNEVGVGISAVRLSKNSTQLLLPRLGREEIIDALNSLKLNYVETDGLPWQEIDTPLDWEKAKQAYFEFSGRRI